MTNKRDWDRFVRQAGSRSKFPVALSEHFNSAKTDLFNMWLDSGKCWTKTSMMVERANEAKNKSTKGWEAIQGRDLRAKYSEEKFNKLVQLRKEQGLYYEDPDFEGDLDEPQQHLEKPFLFYLATCSSNLEYKLFIYLCIYIYHIYHFILIYM